MAREHKSTTGVRATVSVVIPTLNEEASISICLDTVLGQTWEELDVVIADGGSTDRTLEIVEEYRAVDPRVRWLSNPRRTQPAALNTALSGLESEYMVRVDAHSTIPADYVERVMSHLGTGKWGGVGGRKDGVAYTEQGRAIAAALGSRFGVGNSTYHHGTVMQTVDHIPFGAYPVAVARELGGWDEGTPTNEDFEFDYRVRRSGRELLFDPDIVISWETRQTIGSFFQQYRRYGRAKALTLRKHPSSASPRHVLPACFVVGLMLAAVLLPFRPRWALAIIGPYVAAIGAATVVAARTVTDDGARKWLPGAFAAMHIGHGVGMWEGLVLKRLP